VRSRTAHAPPKRFVSAVAVMATVSVEAARGSEFDIMMWVVCADVVRDDDEHCLPGSAGRVGEESLCVRRIPDGGMSGRTIAALAAVMVGVLFMAACQPAVNVSRVPAVRTGLPLAPKDPPLLPVDASGKPMHPSVAEGAKVFSKAQCLICHGPEGLGNGPAAGI